MTIEFNLLPSDARVWVYASNRPLSDSEKKTITDDAYAFTESWAAHQIPLKASFTILNNLFLIFGVDTAHHDISGCGIDKSVHLAQSWENKFNLGLFNRTQLEYFDGENLLIINKTLALSLLSDGKINKNTTFINKSVTSIEELKNKFNIPFEQTWAYHQIPQHTL